VFDSFRKACDARIQADIPRWCELTDDGAWCVHEDGDTAIRRETCEIFSWPGKQFLHSAASRLGVECQVVEECPEPPPVETPTPDPPAGECAPLTHIKLVALCVRGERGCFANGRDWNRPAVFSLADAPTDAFWTATWMADGQEVHIGLPGGGRNPCYPGGLPLNRPDGEPTWQQFHNGQRCDSRECENRIDCSAPWGDGHQITCRDHDFPTVNEFQVCARGVCGREAVTIR